MPVTFVTYAAGMLALAGVPIFAGFWSKDEILHAAHGWPMSEVPFYLALVGAGLTAFYMTRQVVLVFYGSARNEGESGSGGAAGAHESPAVMTVPLVVLAVFATLLGLVGTPFAPWFQRYLGMEHGTVSLSAVWGFMGLSVAVAVLGLAAGWWVYGRRARGSAAELDPLEWWQPAAFGALRRKLWFDEMYEVTVVAWVKAFGRACHWVDAVVLSAVVTAVAYGFLGLAWVSRVLDEYAVNAGFDAGCRGLQRGGRGLSWLQDGRVQTYLRSLAVAVAALLLLLLWGCAR
jgi:NADH-quinone oxidoreductase subunit L